MIASNISQRWIRFSLFNLLVVALVGVLMRYKIGFDFNYFDQKFLQHAHAHFAFSGWVTQTIMVLIVHFLTPFISRSSNKLYNILLATNLFVSYGMLFSFAYQGYGTYSLIFSTLSILVNACFTWWCFIDLYQLKNWPGTPWISASLVFNILSSLGTFALAYMMATKNFQQHYYLASVYWYLHFQYNGWFFFACIGLFLNYLKTMYPDFKLSSSVFWLFSGSCIPAYGLSILWLDIPNWIYAIIAISAITQLFAWGIMVNKMRILPYFRFKNIRRLYPFLFCYIALAISLKLILQAGSTIPEISKLAFGFRPIVIAYLHLVLLAITSVFIITYSLGINLITNSKITVIGIIAFVLAVLANEVVLAMQGIGSLKYIVLPGVNLILLLIAITIFISLGFMILGQFKIASKK